MKKQKPANLLILLAILFLARIALTQAGRAAAQIGEAPAWLAPTLLAGAGLIGGGMALLVVILAILYGKKARTWLAQMFDFGDDEAKANEPSPQTITADLVKTVVSLERNGAKSANLVQDAYTQALALAEICKRLQRRSAEQGRAIETLSEALQAVTLGEPLKIQEAAGLVSDTHIANLMLLAGQDANPGYWQDVSGLIAVQLGAARKWQAEYRRLSSALIAEVSSIKARLMTISAQVEIAEAAKPLLEAKGNLETAGRLLRVPTAEAASSAPAWLMLPAEVSRD